MVDFDYCDHECVCQHNGHLEAAQQYSSILSKMMSKNADSEPVSKEEKDKWNNKANQDVVDLIKTMVDKHEEKLDELEEDLDKKVKLILYDLGFGDNVLAKYATIEYVNELVAKIKNETSDLSKYALKTDLDTIKNDIQNKINNLTTEINNIKVTGGKDYSIESFNYTPSNGQLVLKQKNGGEFTVSIVASGIDTSKLVTKEQLTNELTKYAEINKLKRIRVKGNVHSLYGNGDEIIEIPTGSSDGDGKDGKDGGYYKQYFKNNTSETVAPEKPTDGSAPSATSGWTENAVNRKSGEYTWMIQVFVSGDGLYGHYMTPICITGSKGDQGPQGPAGSSGTGADTSDRDFRYYRTEKGHDIEEIQKPDGDNYYDWTDNPQGVGIDKATNVFYDNEWVCVRIKTDGVWGNWIGPVLWSHYGENGTDGDGVEYIFTKTSTGTPTEDPSSWYNNEQSKANGQDSSGSCSWEDSSETYYNNKYFNQDEYIKKNSGWFDDPSNIEDQHPGDKIWVSVRKKRNDSDPGSSETEDAYWHQYSQPKIWSYYAKDGVVDAVIIDVVGETRYVYINPVTKTSKKYDANVTVNMFNSGDPITKTLEFVSFKKSDGTDMSSLQSSFTFTNDAVAINFAEGALNFENDVYYTLTLTGTPQDMTDQKRYAEISFYGISNEGIQAEPGKDGVTAGIYTTASAISYQDGSFYPNEIGAFVRWGEGKTLTEYKPENSGGWQFQYKVDDGDWIDMTTNTIQAQGKNGISFKAHKDDVNLQEYVPIIKSGIDGLNGVTYMIDVSGMTLSYGESHVAEGAYETDVKFTVKLYKKEGNKDYVLQKTDDYECTVSQDPADSTTTPDVTANSDNWYCKISTSEISSKSATIKIIITTDPGGAFICSMVIPISAAGKDGEATTGQTFKGSPLRMSREVDGQTLTTWKSGLKYYDGKRDAEDGVFYQDVVIYNNMYYVCINTEAGESDQWKTAPDAASYWKVFAVTENFVADKIIANQAYIKELSSEEVVIFDGSTIVAGMTSSKKVDERSDLNGIVTNKGDVRIWAGELKSSGDLTSAPFTVTDAGVLKCQSEEGNSITLQDGTIYFNINGSVYHLGITNGKPDWINSNAADSTETWYQKSGSDTNLSFSQVGTFAIKDNKYYTDATMRTAVDGTYYKKVDAGTILYKVEPYTYLTYGYIFGVEVYNKATFTNGSKVNNGTVAITGAVHTQTIPSENGGTLNVNTTNKAWAKITRVDKPTGSFTYYVADHINSSSQGSVPYTNVKSDDITFNYNTNNGIYIISASDTESPNLASMLSSWRQNIGTGSSDESYEIINNNLTGGFIIS